jgi:hypothetical protein
MSAVFAARLSELELRVRELEARVGQKAGSPTARSETKPSPREFLLAHMPKSDNDKTLAAGYYIEMIAGNDSFNFDDIEAFYGQAKEAAPMNRRDPPYQNVRKGYFREVGKRQAGKNARNRWALTNLGIERVESGFTKK